MARKIFLNRRVNMIMVFLLIVGLITGLSVGIAGSPNSVADAKGPVSLREAATAGQLTEVALIDKSSPKPVITGKKALFIDGSFYEKADSSVVKQVSDVVKSGVPVVIFGNGMEKLRADIGGNVPYETAQYEINDSLVDIPIAAYGIKMYPGAKNSDGKPVFGVITVAGGPDDMASAISTAQKWAEGKVANAASASSGSQESISAGAGTLAVTPPSWSIQPTSITFTCTHSPYGQLYIVKNYYKMLNDLSPTYDWIRLDLQTETVPGSLMWGNSWHTADTWVSTDVDEKVPGYFLVAHGPTTTGGQSTVSFTIGVVAGTNGAMASLSAGQSYSIADVQVNDLSISSRMLASWWHDINQNKNVGKYTYDSYPMLIYRIPNGQGSSLIQRFQAQWYAGSYYKEPVYKVTDYNVYP